MYLCNLEDNNVFRYLRIIGRPFDLSGGPLIFLEKKFVF